MILGDLDFIIHQGFPNSPARLPSWCSRLVGINSAHTPQQTACPDLTRVPSSSNRFSVVSTGSHPSHLPWHPKSHLLSAVSLPAFSFLMFPEELVGSYSTVGHPPHPSASSFMADWPLFCAFCLMLTGWLPLVQTSWLLSKERRRWG